MRLLQFSYKLLLPFFEVNRLLYCLDRWINNYRYAEHLIKRMWKPYISCLFSFFVRLIWKSATCITFNQFATWKETAVINFCLWLWKTTDEKLTTFIILSSLRVINFPVKKRLTEWNNLIGKPYIGWLDRPSISKSSYRKKNPFLILWTYHPCHLKYSDFCCI